MKLKDLIDILGSGERIRVATEHGKCWMVDTTVIHFDEHQEYTWLIDRLVTNIYTSDGREETYCCRKLEPAICIIVEGNENGII
jgi:hypothetical protein